MDIDVLGKLFSGYVEKISQYQFTANNPLFWAILVVLALMLTRFWDIRKSFSFSLAVGVVLLATTKIEHSMMKALTSANEFFDPIVIRLLSVIAITVIILYYVFIKTDSAY